ncbi:hypothetical protein [Pseudonocardia humida]|uniref:Uncharacterized protein n=1 Tax=Pseudonocardia humida TaxID=2800819 RepID=A0ABT0ZSU6_9PSEU|nr:hypothetical protein [Pseudonocardia humida]MCO1653815.1 hypothetical protein [Pseudonocardia humida]
MNTATDTRVPAAVAALCDDAAAFPPALRPLPDAVLAYAKRAGAWYADLIGPMVLAADALARLGPVLAEGAVPPPLAVTVAGPGRVPAALAAARALPVELRSVEVAVPADMAASELVDRLAAAVEDAPDLDVYVEVPRDARREPVVAALAGRFRAKFRTGGARARTHPDEAELAGALAAAVAAGVPFKATAGLHRALRNTDPRTGFEQHGFLTLLLATDALVEGRGEQVARVLLAERDGPTVAGLLGELDPDRVRRARAAFTSFGTCSIADPLTELIALGIVTAPDPGATGG